MPPLHVIIRNVHRTADTTNQGGVLPPCRHQKSIRMTLDAIYNRWLSLHPLTEAEQNMLSMRFTVEYNYITYAYTRLGTAMAALRG